MENSRVQEIDSDDSDLHGVGSGFQQKKRFASDPLQFTGIDLGHSSSFRRKNYAYGDSDSDSDSEDDGNVSAAQVALRDKEEVLVQSALARIRRAQERGKREVKLNPEELAALEKHKKRMQSAATSKSRKGSGESGSSSDRRRRRSAMVTVPIVQPEPAPRRRKDRYRNDSPSPTRAPASGPGLMIEGPDGTMVHAPIGYYPPPVSPNRNSPSRPRSSTSSRRSPPPYQAPRHVSDNSRPPSSSSTRMPLPHEADWQPSSRSSRRNSVASQPYSNDPFEYQTSSGRPPPIPGQYAQSGRRNISGPAQIQYSSVKRSPPTNARPFSVSGLPSTSSDPSVSRRQIRVEVADSQDSDDSSKISASDTDSASEDELALINDGVAVEPERERPVVVAAPVRKSGASSPKKKRGGRR